MHFFESYSKQVKRCVEVALNCVEVDRHRRPSVGDIVKNLNETETMIRRSSQISHWLGHDDRGSSIDRVSSVLLIVSSLLFFFLGTIHKKNIVTMFKAIIGLNYINRMNTQDVEIIRGLQSDLRDFLLF